MFSVITFIIGIMLGGFAGALIGFVLGDDFSRKHDAPAPDIFEEDER